MWLKSTWFTLGSVPSFTAQRSVPPHCAAAEPSSNRRNMRSCLNRRSNRIAHLNRVDSEQQHYDLTYTSSPYGYLAALEAWPSSVRFLLSLNASLSLSSGPTHAGCGTFSGGTLAGSSTGTCFWIAASASQQPRFASTDPSA